MKKFISICLTALLVLGLCGCASVSIDREAPVRLAYAYGDVSVSDPLSGEEAATLRALVNGKTLYTDNPSCGFAKDVSFEIGGRIFCPACDTCCIVQDCQTGQYFTISQAERDALEQIFENHGGSFPCV